MQTILQVIDFIKNGDNGDEVTNAAYSIDSTVKYGNTSSNKAFKESHLQSILTKKQRKRYRMSKRIVH